jgi:hypothetical protein
VRTPPLLEILTLGIGSGGRSHIPFQIVMWTVGLGSLGSSGARVGSTGRFVIKSLQN